MPDDKEFNGVNDVTDHYKQILSSDSEEVSEQVEIVKEEPEKAEEEQKEEVSEQPQEEEEIAESEIAEEEPEKPPEEADKGEVRKIKADGKWHEVAEKDVDRRLSMAIHAEQKLEQYNKGLREVEHLKQTYNQALANLKSKTDVSKEMPTKKEEALPQLQKFEIEEEDYDAPWKQEINKVIDALNQTQSENKQLRDMLYNQETDLYASDLEKQFASMEKTFEEETGVKFNDTEKDTLGRTQRDIIKDAIFTYLDRGLRALDTNPEWFDRHGWPREYGMRHAFYEWHRTQISPPQSPQSLTVDDIVKNEKLMNDIKEHLFSEEAEKKKKEEKVIQKKATPPLRGESDEIFENMEEGETSVEAVTRHYKKKHPDLEKFVKI